MDRKQAQEILDVYGSGHIKIEGSKRTIRFARQTEESIAELEQTTDEELVQEWKSLVLTLYIYGQSSVNDLQRINLVELEIDSREQIDEDDLNDWYKKTKEAFKHKETD